MYVCMYLWSYVCMYLWSYVCMYLWSYVCMYVCMISIRFFGRVGLAVWMYACFHVFKLALYRVHMTNLYVLCCQYTRYIRTSSVFNFFPAQLLSCTIYLGSWRLLLKNRISGKAVEEIFNLRLWLCWAKKQLKQIKITS